MAARRRIPGFILAVVILLYFGVLSGCVMPEPELGAEQPAAPSATAPPESERDADAPPAASFDIPALTLVQLRDPLDEPEFYCLDVPGFGASVRLEADLMAHTCKPNNPADEIFTIDAAAERFQMPAYDLCMQAVAAEAGSPLRLAACEDTPLQRFRFGGDGTVRLAGTALCMTVADGTGQPAGGRSHLRRDLALRDCDPEDLIQAQWQMPGTTPR